MTLPPGAKIMPLVADLHYGAAAGLPFRTGEPGMELAYTVPALAAGSRLLVITGTKPIAQQLVVFLGVDGEYYTAGIAAVSGNNVEIDLSLPVEVAAGANMFSFYADATHPNRTGYYAIADYVIRTAAPRRVVKRIWPQPEGSLASGLPLLASDSGTNTGSSTVKAWLPDPTGANQAGGKYVGWRPKKPGRYRAVFSMNKLNAVNPITFTIRSHGVATRSYPLDCFGPKRFEIEFDAFGSKPISFAITGNDGSFLISELIIEEVRSADDLNRGTHVLLGDSWFVLTHVLDRLTARLPAATIIGKGVSGNQMTQLEARFQTDVLDLAPTFVHILAGTNDGYAGIAPSVVEASLQRMIARAAANGITPIAYTASVLSPQVNTAYFNLSRRYANEIDWGGYGGALSDRVRFLSYAVFCPASSTTMVCPLGAHLGSFSIYDRFSSHPVNIYAGTSYPPTATLLKALTTSWDQDRVVLETPLSIRFLGVTHTNSTGSGYVVSGHIAVDLDGENFLDLGGTS